MINISLTNTRRAESYLQATFLLLGLLGVVYGMYLIWKPLGFIVGGVLMFAVGILMNKISEIQERNR